MLINIILFRPWISTAENNITEKIILSPRKENDYTKIRTLEFGILYIIEESQQRTERMQGVITMNKKYDVVIVGGGPAGLTAGIYVGRVGERPPPSLRKR